MTAKQRHEFRQRRLRDSMVSLIGDERFKTFMEEVAEMQRMAMLDACNDRVVANERLLATALGEVRAYQAILDCYQGFIDQAEQGLGEE